MDETPITVETAAAQVLARAEQSRGNEQRKTKNAKEQEILSAPLPQNMPQVLRNLLVAGEKAGTARIPGYPRGSFDYILLDPPCSALGLRPRLSHASSLEELKGYRSYQRQFIDVAVTLLREGGELVFSTCTFDPMENEENVKFILDNYPMELVPMEAALRFGKPGLRDCGLTEAQCEWCCGERVRCRMVQRFNMTEECNSIGFFISKFRKVGKWCVCW